MGLGLSNVYLPKTKKPGKEQGKTRMGSQPSPKQPKRSARGDRLRLCRSGKRWFVKLGWERR